MNSFVSDARVMSRSFIRRLILLARGAVVDRVPCDDLVAPIHNSFDTHSPAENDMYAAV